MRGLVGGLKHVLFSIIYGMSSFPTDELHHFSRWLLHHQVVFGGVLDKSET
jgi:hypothetical protein